MIKIQPANQNQPRVILYPQGIFSLHSPGTTRAPVGACCTRAPGLANPFRPHVLWHAVQSC